VLARQKSATHRWLYWGVQTQCWLPGHNLQPNRFVVKVTTSSDPERHGAAVQSAMQMTKAKSCPGLLLLQRSAGEAEGGHQAAQQHEASGPRHSQLAT